MFWILTFGDSITFGCGESPALGWAGRLKNYFEPKDQYDAVFNLGIPGDTSQDLLQRFEVEAKARARYYYPEDKGIILIAIGTNDSKGIDTSENFYIKPDEFKQNILKLIEVAKKHTKDIVFVGLVPVDEEKTNPFETTYFSNTNMKKYNDIVKDCCDEKKALFVDLFDDWLKKDYKKLLEDELHPNSAGYEEMFLSINKFLVDNKLID